MRRSERRNNLQICQRRDSNTGGSDLWSSTLPLDHGGAHDDLIRFIKTMMMMMMMVIIMDIQYNMQHQNIICNIKDYEHVNIIFN